MYGGAVDSYYLVEHYLTKALALANPNPMHFRTDLYIPRE